MGSRMTAPDSAPPEAIQLAQFFERLTKSSHRWWDGTPVHEKAATVLRTQTDRIASLEAEKLKLQELAATCYAGLGGECDLPVIWLDALNDAANGDPFDLDGLLPYTSTMRAELIKQTNRAAAAEQQVSALTKRLDTANALNTEARNQLAQLSQAQAVPTEGEVVITKNDAGHIVAVTRQDSDGCVIKTLAISAPIYQRVPLHVAPDGWKLVPIQPTDEMIAAAHESDRKYSQRAFGGAMHMPQGGEDHWSAMLAASPTPPARKPLSDAEIAAIYSHQQDVAPGGKLMEHFARAIEAAHGIQGEGNE